MCATALAGGLWATGVRAETPATPAADPAQSVEEVVVTAKKATADALHVGAPLSDLPLIWLRKRAARA